MLLTFQTTYKTLNYELNNNHLEKNHIITGEPTRTELNKAKRINGKLKQESICNNYGVEILLQSYESSLLASSSGGGILPHRKLPRNKNGRIVNQKCASTSLAATETIVCRDKRSSAL